MHQLDTILAAILKDPSLKAKLIANPVAVLAEHGVKGPAGMTIKVVENTPSVFHLVLPHTPATTGELSDDELASAAGGWVDGGTDGSGNVHCTVPN